MNITPKTEGGLPNCTSQDKTRFKKDHLRSRVALNQGVNLNKSLNEVIPGVISDQHESKPSKSLKISLKAIRGDSIEFKNQLQIVRKTPSTQLYLGEDYSKLSYLPDLAMNRKISTTKILEPDEIFGFNKTGGGLIQAFNPKKKKEPLRIMSNKTLDEIKAPVRNPFPLLPPQAPQIDDDMLLPSYLKGRMRYPKDEEIIIAKAYHGAKGGYRSNLRSMKLKAVQEKLLAEKGTRGFFNIKNPSKENSRDVSFNLDIQGSKRKDRTLDEALNELKESISVVQPVILANSAS